MKEVQVTHNWTTSWLLVLIAGILAMGIYFGFERYDRYLRIKAIDDCGKISRFEKKVDEFTTVWYPEPNLYKSCLDDKHIN
jgi:hypothetical protein